MLQKAALHELHWLFDLGVDLNGSIVVHIVRLVYGGLV